MFQSPPTNQPETHCPAYLVGSPHLGRGDELSKLAVPPLFPSSWASSRISDETKAYKLGTPPRYTLVYEPDEL